MPEALKTVCEAAFEDERIARVQALCDEENTHSSRVMQKVGMKYEGRFDATDTIRTGPLCRAIA